MAKAMLTEVEGLFQDSVVPVAAVGGDRRVVFTNPALRDILALPDDCAGTFCYDLFKGEAPEGVPFCTPACRRLHKAAAGELLPPALMWCRRNGGPSTLLEGFLVPLETKGNGNGGLVLYLLRPVEAGTEMRRVVSALSGLHQSAARRPIAALAAEPRRSSPLSAREAEVLLLLQDGLSTRDMGKRLKISPATVRNHVQRVLGKLKAHSRLQAVLNARRLGWL